ncbi:MAG: hypothetical protein K6E64_06935 [Lachnospiraceae bacterium]|nr:hypothetical protein [Lachnospiraceae bacterium]
MAFKFVDKNNISNIPKSEAKKVVRGMVQHAMTSKPMTDAERKADDALKEAMGFGHHSLNPYN